MDILEFKKEIAENLDIKEEFIQYITHMTISFNYLYFRFNNICYIAKLTKTGKIKKNSIRRDIS